ncbi:hypothetical protein [Lachnoclostridium phytofermentans]|uniref:hypothetical protein n=1 Tax=Lachnoclostridium phytofermentans TaxID=66219 RepID=UPI00049555C4|nr:hypothetical protein [Lachnoclostridium phytofermentans]
MDDMTYSEVKLIKANIKIFIDKLEELASTYEKNIDQNEKDFFVFISKHIIFFKYLYLGMGKKYFFKVIISDLYYYIISLIKNEIRYVYVNERSIIENFTRAVMRKTVEEDHVTENLFSSLKEKTFLFTFSDDDYSLIKSEYVTSCGYIHGGDILDNCLAYVFDDYIFDNKSIKDLNKYFERIRKIFKIYDKMLINEYGESISGCFHRQKSVFCYLLGEECLDLLYLVNK